MAETTTTTSAPDWMRPYQQDYLGRAQEIANQPYRQSPGTYTGPNPYLTQAWSATANRAMQGSPVMGAANSQLMNTMNGGFMNANPYLEQQVSNAQGDLTKAWNQVAKPQWDKAMQKSGSFGNTGVAQAAGFGADSLQQNLGRVATDMRGNAYGQERNFMQQAMMAAPTFANQDYIDAQQLMNVGNQAQQFSQAAQNQNNDWFSQAQQYPQNQLGFMGQALGMNNGSTQTQTTPDPSRTSQVVGGAMTGAALAKWLADLYNTSGG